MVSKCHLIAVKFLYLNTFYGFELFLPVIIIIIIIIIISITINIMLGQQVEVAVPVRTVLTLIGRKRKRKTSRLFYILKGIVEVFSIASILGLHLQALFILF